MVQQNLTVHLESSAVMNRLRMHLLAKDSTRAHQDSRSQKITKSLSAMLPRSVFK